jgi:hypothetical protein
MSDKAQAGTACCGACQHFRNDAAYLETAFAGLTSLSSAFGSARSDDGICIRHQRYLTARSCCADFAPVPPHDGQAKAPRKSGALT